MGLFEESTITGFTVKDEGKTLTLAWDGSDAVVEDSRVALQGTEVWTVDPASTEIKYFELHCNEMEDAIGVGLAGKGFPKQNKMPGWLDDSFGYHGDDGYRFVEGNAKGGWSTWGKGATVGVGLKASTGEIFGTLNGELLGLITTVPANSSLYPTIGILKRGEVVVHFDAKDFKYDISKLPSPIVPIFGQLEKVDRTSPKLLVLYVNGVETETADKLKSQLEAASQTANTKYKYQSFFTAETDKLAKALREFAGIYDRSPLVIAVDIEANKKYALPADKPITTENILAFVEDAESGKLPSLAKSAPRPPGDKHPEHPTLTQIVQSSFDELVIQGNKDVLLDVYADWCGPCRNIAPTIELLSEIFADNDNVVIAKLDCDKNDIDRTYLPETSIPNIKLFRGANKKEPVKYSGNRSLDDFLTFLHTNATVTFDLEAAKEKGKVLKVQAEKKALKNVIPIHSADEFKANLNSEGLVIVDYFATWCGPCKTIAPIYAKLSEEFPGVRFLKVDVDELGDVSAEQGISCMPTFKAYKGGKEVGKLEGASTDKLKALVTDNIIGG